MFICIYTYCSGEPVNRRAPMLKTWGERLATNVSIFLQGSSSWCPVAFLGSLSDIFWMPSKYIFGAKSVELMSSTLFGSIIVFWGLLYGTLFRNPAFWAV